MGGGSGRHPGAPAVSSGCGTGSKVQTQIQTRTETVNGRTRIVKTTIKKTTYSDGRTSTETKEEIQERWADSATSKSSLQCLRWWRHLMWNSDSDGVKVFLEEVAPPTRLLRKLCCSLPSVPGMMLLLIGELIYLLHADFSVTAERNREGGRTQIRSTTGQMLHALLHPNIIYYR